MRPQTALAESGCEIIMVGNGTSQKLTFLYPVNYTNYKRIKENLLIFFQIPGTLTFCKE